MRESGGSWITWSAGAQAADDLHAGAVVFADDHRNQMRNAAVDDRGDAHSFFAEDQRGGGPGHVPEGVIPPGL